MSFIYDMADTWNAAGTVFTAIKMNVTDTASQATSLLMDLQVAASSKFSVSKAGVLNGSVDANTFGVITLQTGALRTGSIFVISDTSGIVYMCNGSNSTKGFIVGANFPISWSDQNGASTTSAGTFQTTLDLQLWKDAAGIFAQRNGTTAQAHRVYNTFTSATNYEAFQVDWITTAGICRVGPAVGSSGTLRPMMATFNLITIASLPTPATANRGSHMFVSDANLPIIFTTVSAGGSTIIPVYSNGANWLCG